MIDIWRRYGKRRRKLKGKEEIPVKEIGWGLHLAQHQFPSSRCSAEVDLFFFYLVDYYVVIVEFLFIIGEKK